MIKDKNNYLELYSSKINLLVQQHDVNFEKFCKKLKSFRNKKIIICGNGGSSSIASHFATDISKFLEKKCITFSDHNLITCFANDYGYENWTTEALKLYSNPGDLIILISSSGKSKNIVNAANFVKRNKNTLITFSGFKKNNSLNKLGDINFWVDSTSYNHIEMTHHILLVAAIDRLAV
ncbi:SIS domain-containing protein [Alphaproteobacteria bacterium]|nr:SIS domain-containing protein [Alphaproteobacteria bacterium]